jgi:hypothetical protein
MVRIAAQILAIFTGVLLSLQENGRDSTTIRAQLLLSKYGGPMLQAGRSPVCVPDEVKLTHYGRGIDSATSRNEYQESSWG